MVPILASTILMYYEKYKAENHIYEIIPYSHLIYLSTSTESNSLAQSTEEVKYWVIKNSSQWEGGPK